LLQVTVEPLYKGSEKIICHQTSGAPTGLADIIDDLFGTITLFSNRVVETNYKKSGNEYEVTLKVSTEKFRADTEKPFQARIEVKSGRLKSPSGIPECSRRFHSRKILLVGADGIPVEEYLRLTVDDLMR
jgi:hypothetical protein